MTSRINLTSAAIATLAVAVGVTSAAAQGQTELRAPPSFMGITDEAARSVALFNEAGKVITDARCVNCHPRTDRPLQGDAGRLHLPRVVGGEAGMGSPGLACVACHGAQNVTLVGTSLRSVPGNPKWQLAPLSMAWEGKSLGAICEQIKDPARNGSKTLAQIHDHMAHDELVGWGWDPGPGRRPAPGSQAVFGELIKAWIDTGSVCPKPLG